MVCDCGTPWTFLLRLLHIKEILAVFLAICRCASSWTNKRIYIQSDNMTLVATINRGTSPDPFVMSCLRVFFWLSGQFNFQLTAKYIPGLANTVADDISRIHEPGRLIRFIPYVYPSPLCYHMSRDSFAFLFGRYPSQREDADCPGTGSCHPESTYIC